MVVFYSYVSLPEGIQSTKSSSMMRSSGESQFRQVSEDRPIIFFAEPPLAKIPKKKQEKKSVPTLIPVILGILCINLTLWEFNVAIENGHL